MLEPRGLGRFSARQLALLWLILSAGLLLRLIALDWGLPPNGPARAAAGLQGSYARGEAGLLRDLTQPGAGRWALPHHALTLGVLRAAERAGAFDGSWAAAWRRMRPGAFERVYLTARLATVAVSLLALYLAAMIALRFGGVEMALWAAALTALAPGQVLEAGQIRPEVTLTASALLLWLAVLAGVSRWKSGLAAALLAAALAEVWMGRAPSAQSLLDFARFWTGVPTALLAAAGFFVMPRRAALAPAVFAAAVAVWLRDWLPLSALCTVMAAAALIRAGRWGRPLGAAALFVAASASFSVVSYRIAPHPANMALLVIERVAEPGDQVSRTPGFPPLDPAVYPAGPHHSRGDPAADPPEWVVLSDLPPDSDSEANLRLLAERYERMAVFRRRSRTRWATLGESGAPEDWKRTRPEMTIYRRK